jgi:hypothetical protein
MAVADGENGRIRERERLPIRAGRNSQQNHRRAEMGAVHARLSDVRV